MIGEIIAIGDELTSGRILNMTSSFAAYHLFAQGHEIVSMATIGDSPEMIGSALKRAIRRADFVIVTGGLGPTTDDLTNEAVATALNRPAIFHPEILEKIQRYLEDSGRREDPNGIKLEKLAWLPEGAEELKPEANMAGHILIHDRKPIFFLPGVPHEMKELLVDCVIPRLNEWQHGEQRFVRQRLYRVFGPAETEINERVRHLENDSSLIRLGYYPVFPEVHLSLTALGKTEDEGDALFAIFDAKIRRALGDDLYGVDNETLAAVAGRSLAAQGLTLALAESCTGGLAAHEVTTVAGSSRYFLGGVVAYANEVKTALLHVPEATLAAHGAVSPETACAMAAGVRAATGADFGVAITGIAGPDGGSAEKPVGTVWFGISHGGHTRAEHRAFTGSREQIQGIAARTALDLIRRETGKK